MGSYSYGQRNTGKLHDFKRLGEYGGQFRWTESVGVGTLRITFAPDLRNFTGYWEWPNEPGMKNAWTGRR